MSFPTPNTDAANRDGLSKPQRILISQIITAKTNALLKHSYQYVFLGGTFLCVMSPLQLCVMSFISLLYVLCCLKSREHCYLFLTSIMC